MSSSRFEIRPIAEELQAKYSAGTNKLIEVRYTGDDDDDDAQRKKGKEGYVPVFDFFEGYLEIMKDFKVRDDDIWILTYPKSGTTLGTEMIWLLCYDLDYEEAAKTELIRRLTHFEMPCTRTQIKDYLIKLEAQEGQRIIRSHLPLSLLPTGLFKSKAKIVYITRNPMDTAISLYHHNLHFNRCQNTTLEDSLSGFLTGQMALGSYFDHVSEFRRQSHCNDNVIFVTFEEMKYSMSEVLNKLCKYLAKSYGVDQLRALEAHLHFDQMKKNPSVNFAKFRQVLSERFQDDNVGEFIRKGKVGGYQEEMPSKYIELFHEKINQWDCKDLFEKWVKL